MRVSRRLDAGGCPAAARGRLALAIAWTLAAMTAATLPAAAGPPPDPRIYWVYLAETPPAADARPAPALAPRAVARLARAGRPAGTDIRDFAVSQEDLAPLRERGIAVRHVSRWLRAASARLTPEQAASLASDPRVRAIRRAGTYVRPLEEAPVPAGPAAPPPWRGSLARHAARDTDPADLVPADYGLAWHQLEMIGVTDLHAAGYSGEGVRIAIFDTGFMKSHDSLRPLALVAERDFLCGDGDVQYDPGRPCDEAAGDRHGTLTWSALAGFAPGALVGAAYRAEFVLARTEAVAREVHLEEDNYIAALEWADSLGVDLISTSLGYRSFDDGTAYDLEDLDGGTVPISIAANLAVERGMVLVTAMGNEGPEEGTLIAPADAPDVISAGACDYAGEVVGFSSRGPTGDGRIKPDLIAHGYGTVSADSRRQDQFTRASGTSLATPVLAGLAALLIEARPGWTPLQIKAALESSADRAVARNPGAGAGLPSGAGAVGAHDLRVSGLLWDDGGDGEPESGERGALSVEIENRGAGAWPGGMVEIVASSEQLTVQGIEERLGALEPGERAVLAFDVTIGTVEEETILLEFFVRFSADGPSGPEVTAPRERSVRLLAGRRCVVDSFTATPGSSGEVDVAWRISTPTSALLTGLRLFREDVLGARTPMTDGLMDRGATDRWEDHPPATGTYRYVLLLDQIAGLFTEWAHTEEVVIGPPSIVRLDPPRPNPVREGALQIPIRWPRAGRPRIEIIDVLGRRVRTLDGPELEPGFPTIAWDLRGDDGREVISGLYFLRLRGDGAGARRVFVIR